MNMETVLNYIPDAIQVLTLIVTAAAIVAAATKTPKDDTVVKKIRKVVDFLALNFGGAKNKDK
jgi:hypothetical protein